MLQRVLLLQALMRRSLPHHPPLQQLPLKRLQLRVLQMQRALQLL